jgi:hypothetical protein
MLSAVLVFITEVRTSPLMFFASSAVRCPVQVLFVYAWMCAETADNVFYHLTYEGAVDVSKVSHPQEKHCCPVCLIVHLHKMYAMMTGVCDTGD